MTTTAPAKPEEKVLTEEDFPHVTWNGIPFFFANNQSDVANILKVFNLTHFYILGTSMEYDTTAKKQYDAGVKMFLVVNNTLGVSIQHVYGSPLANITEGTKLNLPKIPRKMIASIDALFRETHRLIQTEAIVILTYDTSKSGAEGWSYVVPVQANTGGHCDYQPESVAEKLPNDTTIIVGTAHSHPGMKAYKSDTDQKDQLAAGDGIHMTFGWQSSTNAGATEFYCEIQFGSYQQQVTPQYLFDDFDYKVDMDAISAEIEKSIKKTSFQNKALGTTWSGPSQGGSSQVGYQGNKYATTIHNTTISKNRLVNLPSSGPKKDDATILVPVYKHPETDKFHCHGCSAELCPPEIERRKCMICKTTLMFPDDTLDSIIAIKKESKTSWDELNIDTNPKFPIFIWKRNIVPGTTEIEDEFEMIYAPESKTLGK